MALFFGRSWAAVAAALLLLPPGGLLAAPPERGGALPGPLPLFPVTNWWNQDVSLAPVDPASAAFVNFIGPGQPLHPDLGGEECTGCVGIYGMPYIVVDSAQPKRTVTFYYDDESDHVAYPIPDEAITQAHWIEGGEPGNQDPGGDRHMLIVDRDNKYLYELYSAHYDGSKWTAGSGAFFDMKTNNRRPEGWTSADAAGLAILPGLLRYDEVFGPDEIRHALRVTVRATNGHVWPASHSAGSTSGALPMGARLRLKATKDVSGFPAEVQKIFRAMKAHGLIVADNGADMYVGGTFDTRWDNDVLNPAFAELTAGDFEVIERGWQGIPTLSLSTPNGGESWPAGSIQAIAWASAALSPSATVRITYSNGAGTTTVASGLPRTQTSYIWTVPNTPGSATVTVCSLVGSSCEVSDTSDASFSIVAAAGAGARFDLDGDGEPDLLWRNQSTGSLYAWLMDGTAQSSGTFLTSPAVGTASWQVRGIDDLTGDGKNDLLWHNQSTGALYVWFMNGIAQSSGAPLTPATVNPVWQVRGLADFDADGKPDILWHNRSTGALYVWFMNRIAQSSGVFLNPATVNPVWQIRGLADFNADGKPDILWHNQSTGALYVWLMNGTVQSSGVFLSPASVANLAWQVRQVGDFNRDGKPDVLWHNRSTGALYVWLMNGTVKSSATFLTPAAVANLTWQITPQ